MAHANGFTCDNPACRKFEVAVNTKIPDHWITFKPQVNGDAREEKHVCGNVCLAEIAMQRWEADHPGKRFTRSRASVPPEIRRSGDGRGKKGDEQ